MKKLLHLSLDSEDVMATGDHTIPLLETKSRTRAGRIKHSIACFFRTCIAHKNSIAVFAGPMVATLIWVFVRIDGDDDGNAASMLAILSWVFIWWVTEAIPVAITAMAPLFLLPFAEIRTASEVAKSYMNDTIFLLIGSFILAAAVEHYQLHKRLALNMLVIFGGKWMDPWLLLLGFCLGTAFISMWIHNTAVAVMMMPVGLGVLQKAEVGCDQTSSSMSNDTEMQGEMLGSEIDDLQELKKKARRNQMLNFARAVVLAISYAATLGGMATLTGTGVNLILAGLYESAFPTASPITYLQWLLFGLPMAASMVILLWLLLCFWFCPRSSSKTIADSLHISHIQYELASLGAMCFAEIVVLSLFGILVLLWVTKSLGTQLVGWGQLFDDYPGDGTVCVLIATMLFIIPSRQKPGEKLMDWKRCKNIPWNIILLLGGGFALADGMTSSGLSDCISDELDFLQSAPYLLITPVIGVLTGIMTEFTSNNSTATIFVSLVAQVAISIGRHPLFLMVPAAIGSQFSFMLPIATPPNAIGYSTGYLRTMDMVTIGLILKIIGILLLSILMPTLGAMVFQTNS